MQRVNNLIRWLNVGLILLTFLSYLSPYINPVHFWPVTFFGIAYPWLLLANLLFVGFWVVSRRWYFLFSLACILMGWSHLTAFWGFNTAAAPVAPEVKVMSYNIQYLQYIKGKKAEKEKKIGELARFLGQADPDILCLQESGMYSTNVLKEALGFEYQYRVGEKGTAILSKFPFANKGLIDFGTTTNSCLWADLNINGKAVRIYSAHLQSNKVSGIASDVIETGDLQERETWSDIRGMIGRVKRASAIRVEQARTVKAHAATSPHPALLCADLNDTPQSYIYRLFSEGFNDAFCKKGFGIGTTYAGIIPALRIDYVFTSPELVVQDFAVLRKNYSDHYPVMCSLKVNHK